MFSETQLLPVHQTKSGIERIPPKKGGYTPAMNTLIKAYKNTRDIEKQAVYVFLMNMPHKTATLEGYMPFNKQFAFVFTEGTADDATAHNIAHEIAHGTFNLRHTFSPNNTYTLPEKTTDNLMDYKGPGNHRLDKYQWDLIHDPERVWFSWLESEGEGALVNIMDLIEKIREANKKEYNVLEILQDKCPQGFFKNKKIGDYTLAGIQINCSKVFEGNDMIENLNNQWIDWTPAFSNKATIIPGEIQKVFSKTTLGNAVYFQFHEAKQNPVPQKPELTNNLMFEFAVLEKDYKDFEIYLFPKPIYFIESINHFCQIDDEINGLDCRWCSNWEKCCNGDNERIEDDKGKLICADGSKYGTNNCCFATSQYMIVQSGNNCGTKKKTLSEYFVNLVNVNDCRDGVTSNTNISTNETILSAIRNIKKNIPLMAGVFYDYEIRPNDEKAPGNTTLDKQKSPSNHFIVIVGYGTDNDEREYFRFFDPASSSSGDNEQNKLYFDKNANIIKGKRANDIKKNYILTEIRLP